MDDEKLLKFVEESNKIEGYEGATPKELEAHRGFLAEPMPTVSNLERFVSLIAPRHVLRSKVGLDVRVGSYIAPAGGPDIPLKLKELLQTSKSTDPYLTHCDYETLHPFTDGNGRSGRALWLWMMLHRGGRDARMATQLGFLHSFYYQTLSNSQSRLDK